MNQRNVIKTSITSDLLLQVKRLQGKILEWKWKITACVWVVALFLGYFGYLEYYIEAGEPYSIWDIIYRTLLLPKLGFTTLPVPINPLLQTARFLAPAAALITVALSILGIFYNQLQLFHIRRLKNHIIICGLGRKGLLLSDSYKALGKSVLIIERDANNVLIEHCKGVGILVMIGDATDPSLLKRARICMAESLISVCGDDGTNAQVSVQAYQASMMRKGKPLSCLVHIVNLRLWSLLREFEFQMSRQDIFRIGFFNVYESGAKVMLYEHNPFINMTDKSNNPHIVVVGIGRMGASLIVNAARKWRDNANANSARLRITMVDRNAQEDKESICFKYPNIENVCELIPIEMEINSIDFEQAKFLYDDKGHCNATIIYVCIGEDSESFTAALKLNQNIKASRIPIVVRMNLNNGLAILCGKRQMDDDLSGIKIFPLLEQTCTPNLLQGEFTIEIIARAIHEDYLLNCKNRGESTETNQSMVSWESLPESLKESNRRQAQHIIVKLEHFGYQCSMTTDWDPPLIKFLPEEIEEMAKIEHERFVDERVRDGWRYGESKDVKRKINPTLVPWDQLSKPEKDKDRSTVQGIPVFLARVGYQVYKLKDLQR